MKRDQQRSDLYAVWAQHCARLLQDDSGQDLIEYALIAALIGLGAIVSVKSLGTKIAATFASIATSFTSEV